MWAHHQLYPKFLIGHQYCSSWPPLILVQATPSWSLNEWCSVVYCLDGSGAKGYFLPYRVNTFILTIVTMNWNTYIWQWDGHHNTKSCRLRPEARSHTMAESNLLPLMMDMACLFSWFTSCCGPGESRRMWCHCSSWSHSQAWLKCYPEFGPHVKKPFHPIVIVIQDGWPSYGCNTDYR
jgi:hypothetical protein